MTTPALTRTGRPRQPYHNPKHLRNIFFWIKHYIAEHGVPPSKTEMAAKYKVSTSVIDYWLRCMAEEGMLERLFGVARGIKLNLNYDFKKEKTHDRRTEPTA